MNLLMEVTNSASSVPVTTTAGGTASMSVAAPKPMSVADYIRQIEARIAVLGPGPHTPQQKEDLRKLNAMLQKMQQPQQQRVIATKDSTFDSGVSTPNLSSLTSAPSSVGIRQSNVAGMSSGGAFSESKVIDKKRIQELVKEVDPLEQMDDDVEEMLMQIADDFIDNVVTASCLLAKHRKSNTVEVKDVQLHLERNWNMWIPGFGSEELRPYKKAATTEAHKQRMALIKKTLKKY